jgi:hypothetical protein
MNACDKTLVGGHAYKLLVPYKLLVSGRPEARAGHPANDVEFLTGKGQTDDGGENPDHIEQDAELPFESVA